MWGLKKETGKFRTLTCFGWICFNYHFYHHNNL